MKKILSPLLLLTLFVIIIMGLASFVLSRNKPSNLQKTAMVDTSDYVRIFSSDTTKTIEERIAECDIKSIKIETTPCFGKCPVFTAEFHNDGVAYYNGEMNTKLEGKYKGELYEYNFLEICDYIKFANIEKLKKGYMLMATDLSSTTITINYKDGSSKSIYEYGNAAPVQFKFLKIYLRHLINDFVKWEKVNE